LQTWLAACTAVDQGNIQGLPPLDGKPALKRMLASLLYRIIAHGGTNMVFETTLVHLFAANFPICLQRRDIPDLNAQISTKELMTYLPNTQTIGLMASFYYTFGFSKPLEPFVPKEGVEAKLFFPGGTGDPRNRALIAYRNALVEFVKPRAIIPDAVYQWPLNVET
jgi:hypothetical protein